MLMSLFPSNYNSIANGIAVSLQLTT
uniref:Uncharacterized protein n=1 Tax=Arundo donax TaxID=35708 RepID=A0A0A8Z6P6_ARUDO